MKKNLLKILFILLFALVGCSSGGVVENDDGPTRIFTDSLGREIELPETITRAVPSGRTAQIALYTIAPDEMVALASAFDGATFDYIGDKYQELPELGSFFGSGDLNYEEISKLNPQVVVDFGEAKDGIEEDMEEITNKTGVPVVHISATVSTMDEAYEKLGELFNKKEEAAKMADYCKEAYETALEVSKTADLKTVLYLTSENGENVIAKDSYHSQVIDLLSDNLAKVDAPSSKGSGNEVGMEQILVWNPEVIIFSPGSYYNYVTEDPVWQELSAIQSDSYYEVPTGPYNWMGFPPSSNRVLALVWMPKLLYPDVATYDLKEKVQEFYQLFYHCELSDEQYNTLVEHSIGKVQ